MPLRSTQTKRLDYLRVAIGKGSSHWRARCGFWEVPWEAPEIWLTSQTITYEDDRCRVYQQESMAKSDLLLPKLLVKLLADHAPLSQH